MSNDRKRPDSIDFTTGRILPQMIRFMLPLLGALVLQAMYGAVDILIVGRYGSTEGISGVSTGSSLVNMVVFVITGLAMGVTILIGRFLGEKRNDRIGSVVGGAIAFFAAASAVLMTVMLLFARPLAVLMQAPAQAVDATVTYVRICGGGIVFIVAYNFISSIFRGMGDSRLPLIFVTIATLVNIAGDLLLVAVLRMDVAGAALATVLAQAVSVVLSLLIIRKKPLPFRVTRRDIRFSREIGLFVRLGSPIAFQELLTQVSFLALCAFINRLGLEQSAGYGVAQKVVGFVMLVPASIMQSTSAMVSQCIGAGNEKRARRVLLIAMSIGLCIGVPVALLTFFAGDRVSAIFASDPGVVAQSFAYLRGFAIEAVVTAVLFSHIGYFNGRGMTLFVMIQGLAQSFLIRLPVSYLMSIGPDPNLTRIGLAAPSATVFGILLNVGYMVLISRRADRAERLTLPEQK